MQNIALTLTLVVMAVVAGAFLWVVAGASQGGGDGASMARNAYRIRGKVFWAVIVAGVVISFWTLWQWPIAGHASAATKPDAVIRAVGHQWRWELDRDTVRAGELVQFEVTAADVNHSFAIYDNKDQVIAQAQAMPGYVNKLQVRFDEPGEYAILCLEYCGLAHHGMRTVINVRPRS